MKFWLCKFHQRSGELEHYIKLGHSQSWKNKKDKKYEYYG